MNAATCEILHEQIYNEKVGLSSGFGEGLARVRSLELRRRRIVVLENA